MSGTCEACRFFFVEVPIVDTDDGYSWGVCRRYAPRPAYQKKHIASQEQPTEWSWPAIAGDQWCGEFKERK